MDKKPKVKKRNAKRRAELIKENRNNSVSEIQYNEPTKKEKKPSNKKIASKKITSDRKTSTSQPNTQKKKKTSTLTVSQFRNKGLTLVKSAGKKTKGINPITACVCIVLVVFIIVFAFVLVNSPSGVVETVSSKFAMNASGDGFPVEYDLSTGKNLYFSNGQLLVLTQTDLKCYNQDGNEVYSRVHGYANPVVKTSSLRTLIYDLNGTSYEVHTPNEEVLSNKCDFQIVCGDISNSGVFALVTESDNDVAVVTVYSKNANEIFKFHSENYYITGVSVSENGKYICVSSTSTKKAEFVSKLSIYSLSQEKPLFEKEYSNELVYTTEYSDNSNVAVITDKRYFTLTQNGVENEYNFSSAELNKYEISDDYITLLLRADSNAVSSKIVILGLDGEKISDFSIDCDISDISASNDYVWVLSDKLIKYSINGEKQSEFTIQSGANKIKSFNSSAVVLYASGIELEQ